MTCSFRPIAQFPWPSKDAGLTPLKSLTRGRAIEMKRSRNSHMRSPRRVTLAPTGMPSRILNPAMDFLASLSWAFWPVILARSSIAPSMARLLTTASPTPMLTTIFSRPGIRMGFSIPNLSLRFGATSSMYLSLILAIDILPGLLADPDLFPRVRETVANLGRLAVRRVDQHHVRGVYGGLEVVEPLLVLLARPRVSRTHVDAVYHDPVLPGKNVLDLAALTFLFAGDHHHSVPALQFETHLQHLRSERDDPGVTLLPELARHGTEDTRPTRCPIRVDDDPGVLAEADVGPVVSSRLFLGPYHDGPYYLALLDRATRGRLLDGGHDDITDARRAPFASAEHADGQDAPRPRVIRNPQPGFLLYHYSALDITLASRHRLRAESGLVSMILTVSPTRASLLSSCTMNFLERRTRFLYMGCRTRASTATVTVLSALSETMSPTRSLRRLRSVSVCIWPSSWSNAGPLEGPASRPASTVSPASTRSCGVSATGSSVGSSVSGVWFLSSSTTTDSPAVYGSGPS